MARPSLIRDINQVRVLNLLRERGLASRAEIAQVLGLTRSTVTNLVNSLLQQDLVIDNGTRVMRHGTGRPGVGIQLNPKGTYFIGADLGVEELNTIIINLQGHVIARGHMPFKKSDAPQDVLKRLAELILKSLADAGLERARVNGIGVTLPATVDGGRLLNAPLLAWHDIEVAGILMDMLQTEVIVENDANAAALAQLYFGRDRVVKNLVYLSLGSGVGAGIVIDGRIYRGSFGAAGEVGYMRLAVTGPMDTKGNQGTLEAFVGIPGLLGLYREHGGEHEKLDVLLSEYKAGLSSAVDAVREWAHWLGRGVVTLFNVLNPERIVLGGPLSPLLPAVVGELRMILRTEQLPGNTEIKLDISPFGTEDTVMGAATLAYHDLFSVSGVST